MNEFLRSYAIILLATIGLLGSLYIVIQGMAVPDWLITFDALAAGTVFGVHTTATGNKTDASNGNSTNR